MLQQVLGAVVWIVGAAVVVGIAGAVVGEILRFISRRMEGSWLFGNLTLGEGFGLGLVVATFIVAGAYSAFSGGEIPFGSAWFRYAAGAVVAFAAYGIVASRRRPA